MLPTPCVADTTHLYHANDIKSSDFACRPDQGAVAKDSYGHRTRARGQLDPLTRHDRANRVGGALRLLGRAGSDRLLHGAAAGVDDTRTTLVWGAAAARIYVAPAIGDRRLDRRQGARHHHPTARLRADGHPDGQHLAERGDAAAPAGFAEAPLDRAHSAKQLSMKLLGLLHNSWEETHLN
jgi:hypothetical protein